MPRDRALCDKAVREAWKRERELVIAGKGTRDWTEEQQLEIIELGKAYDDNGKAYEGQHMKSASEYPEHQGNPDNIQLVSNSEHWEAHKHNWQNPTNWFYDTVTHEFICFGDADPVACKVIELTHPFLSERGTSSEKALHTDFETQRGENNTCVAVSDTASLSERKPILEQPETPKIVQKKGIRGKIVSWAKEHPMAAVVATGAIGTTIAVLGSRFISSKVRNKHKNESSRIQPTKQAEHPVVLQPIICGDLLAETVTEIGEQLNEAIQHSNDLTDEINTDAQNHEAQDYNIADDSVEQSPDRGVFNTDGLRACSLLYQMNYRAYKPIEERHEILDEYVSIHGVESAKILLRFLINTRSARKDGVFGKTIPNWIEDYEYVSGTNTLTDDVDTQQLS